MIITVEKDLVATEVAQVMLKFLEDKEADFPRGLLQPSPTGEVIYTEEAVELYNELYDIISDVMNEFKIKENEH
tara:strand:- start:106 stop:327 length:222 start_codon:yes stop_codon:yes gene_type:complete